MKVQYQLTHGGVRLFDHHHEPPPTSLTLGYKRLRHIAPKLLIPTTTTINTFLNHPTLRESSSSSATSNQGAETVAVAVAGGGTRWNPTQEQIGILEMLYSNGMRTPNANQIEEITSQLAKFGKIEGKNVFYWFQNHKARERQKLKRNIIAAANTATTTTLTNNIDTYKMDGLKRKFEGLEEDEGEKMTLELFPLHPEGRWIDDGKDF